ncbi:MAG: hypothetical protein V7608_3421 [Hyphomicrobiales bacterium]|jgi:hypothetical protein
MFRSLITLMLACLFAVVMIYVEGPGLMRDFELRNARLVPAQDLKVEEAQCEVHWWILSHCSISYSAPQAREKKYWLSFSAFGTFGGERFHLMRAPDNHVTTDIGVAKLVNRVTAMTVLMCIFAATGFFAFRRAVEAM